jgi:hypothetical protein
MDVSLNGPMKAISFEKKWDSFEPVPRAIAPPSGVFLASFECQVIASRVFTTRSELLCVGTRMLSPARAQWQIGFMSETELEILWVGDKRDFQVPSGGLWSSPVIRLSNTEVKLNAWQDTPGAYEFKVHKTLNGYRLSFRRPNAPLVLTWERFAPQEDACAICLDPMDDDTSLRRLIRCGHIFHTNCLKSWGDLGGTCPMCRTKYP